MAIAISNHSGYIHTEFEIEYADLPLMERVWDAVVEFFQTMCFLITTCLYNFFAYLFSNETLYCTPSGGNNHWRKENDGLVVFLTGLQGHPSWAASYVENIAKDRPQLEVRIPWIPHSGDCTLEEAATSVIDMVRDYIKQNPGKPITLIGTSNGGRIAGKVETALRSENVAIRIGSIAGVFFGSERVSFLKKICLGWIYSEAIMKELAVGSPVAEDLIQKMRRPIYRGERDYTFYATANDFNIPNTSSCFPEIHQPLERRFLKRCGHVSITEVVREEELQRTYAWMDAHKVSS